MSVKIAQEVKVAAAGSPKTVKVVTPAHATVLLSASEAVRVTTTVREAVAVLAIGPPGPPGAGGSGGDAHYEFTQAIEAGTWTITHSLGKKPNVQIFDASNRPVLCDIAHPSNNQVVLTHTTPIAGYAILN